MHIPFIVVALAFAAGSTLAIILLMERHVIRPAPPTDPTAGLAPDPENQA